MSKKGNKGRAKGRATIYEVADRAGVSIATVSRVLNDGPVSGGTRERVWRAIGELGYVPNSLARGLSQRRTGTLGLILPGIAGEFWIDIIAGAEEEAAKHGYYLIVSASWEEAERASSLRMIMEGRVDGLILIAPELEEEQLLGFAGQGFPLVLINRRVQANGVRSLIVNNLQGAYRVVSHLVEEHGKRRIGFIAGPEGNIDSIERFRGYRKALEEGGLSYDPRLVARGDFRYESGAWAMEKLLGEEPEAVFAANDEMAIAAMEFLLSRGIAVPGEVAVVGFDDIRLARYIQPPLTTVRFPRREMGTRAVESLMELISAEGLRGAGEELLETELVVRSSCGCEPVLEPQLATTSPEAGKSF